MHRKFLVRIISNKLISPRVSIRQYGTSGFPDFFDEEDADEVSGVVRHMNWESGIATKESR